VGFIKLPSNGKACAPAKLLYSKHKYAADVAPPIGVTEIDKRRKTGKHDIYMTH
jgi:hypothetical protein